MKDLGVREGHDLDGDALRELFVYHGIRHCRCGTDGETHSRAQNSGVLAVVRYEDKADPRHVTRVILPFARVSTHVSAASARTFSRRWQPPPPLIQFRSWSTLDSHLSRPSQTKVCRRWDSLIRTIDGHVNDRVLVHIAQQKLRLHDQLLRLEAYPQRVPQYPSSAGDGSR